MIINNITEINSGPLFLQLKNIINSDYLFLKLEGLNIATSIKLKPAIKMVEKIERTYNTSANNTIIICSSSGNLGIAISIVCKQKGYQAICVSDPNISYEAKKLIRLYGGKLYIVKKKDANGGYLLTRINLIKNLLSKIKNSYWVNQYENEENINTHYTATAPEILKEINKVDYLFIGAGTTGTLGGCSKYFREFSPQTKIIAVDAEGSVTFNQLPKRRKIPGLGTSHRPPLAQFSTYDKLIFVPEETTIKTAYQLLHNHGLFLGGSACSVVSAVIQCNPTFKKNDTIVAIIPDFGFKYINTIYNKTWLEKYFPNLQPETV